MSAASSSFSSSSSSASSSSSSSSPPAPTLENILLSRSLRWIFVGGKGGVGKTTTSCSLAVALSRCRSSVLLISTDPAHNLSDAFNQKFSKHPTLVSGYQNLFAMEIDPTVEIETGDVLESATTSLISDLASSIPGIDEAMSFAELMKQVQTLNYETIVFDTAPTGHTLRLLSFPSVLTKAFDKLQQLRSKFSGVFSQMQSLLSSSMNVSANNEEKLLAKMEDIKKSVDLINQQFRDPAITTFVCVCIPEFLSLYETERLIQELAKYEIDSKNVVVNQILFPEDDCKKCRARFRMQKKYLDQIFTLYDDFHVITMPLLDEEVRGTEAIQIFSKMLIEGHGKKFKETNE